MPAPANLKRRLTVAFALDVPSLTASILAQLSETWRATLTQEARAVGSSRTGQGPSGRDLSELSSIARRDADSIANTFQRDLERQIDRIYDNDPTAGRDVYVSELQSWAANRAEWKDRQIATMNRGNARQYAQQRFNIENQSGEALYLFAGPPPRESECAGLFAAGLVDRTFTEAHPVPVHVNCPHTWDVQQTRIGVPISQLWVG